jgi:regulator of sirC expression with transglutaminase-like and TPR domain
VLTEVCKRLDIEAEGVSFPGHFLVRAVHGAAPPLLVDPFAGHILTRSGLRALASRTTGKDADPAPEMLVTASKKDILARMLRNLRAIYANAGDGARLIPVLERLHVVAPSDDVRTALERLGGQRSWPAGNREVN